MPTSRREVRARSLVWAGLAFVLATVIAVGLWQVRAGGRAPAEPDVYGTVPSFTLTERSGRQVTAEDLAGRPWIADFVFTRCQGICPALTSRLAALLRQLQARGIPDARAVSFTVDPEHDDPATLRAYAERFGADPERWLFLTGDKPVIEHLVREGFRLSIAELPAAQRETNPEPITHSNRFVLVDGQGRIRGYYHGSDEDEIAKLADDYARLRR
jgi:protein SCO1